MRHLRGIDDENAPTRDTMVAALVEVIHIFMYFSVLLSTIKSVRLSTIRVILQ